MNAARNIVFGISLLTLLAGICLFLLAIDSPSGIGGPQVLISAPILIAGGLVGMAIIVHRKD
jgi:hypothetical protein